ncbi:hypothetical protein AYO47_01170 [Planctomyces sp. SCGC AG-212-M04]|nr:hypothetical protein AYO47_01170 [Planctomyces sp. SCGC AG-212-M04]
MVDIESGVSIEPAARRASLRPAIGIWLLGCLLVGVGCFVLIGKRLVRSEDPLLAAVWWQLSFAVALAVILAAIVRIQSRRGETLSAIGWRKSTSKLWFGAGVMLGVLYAMGVYAGIHESPAMKGVNPFELHWVRFVLIPVGVFMAAAEEIMMRGFFMTELQRAGVGTGWQIVFSGLASAAYHSFHNPSLIGFIPSFVLFSMHAALYVLAGRSLTPTVVAHSLYHVLCAPYLLMFAMTQMPG